MTVCVLMATLDVAVRSLKDEKVSTQHPKYKTAHSVTLFLFFFFLFFSREVDIMRYDTVPPDRYRH